ncbi:MAG: glycosyltransferase [Ardenticatenales bacterium]|nr:glycosyltransferase [Ardenticatenales bacterium]
MPQPLRLAFASPLPPTRSGIADFSAALLPYLAAGAELTLFVDRPDLLAPALQVTYPCHPLSELPARRAEFDLPIYQIGNNSLHAAIYEMALRYPGLTVLHDLDLSQFRGHELLVEQGDFAAYGRELARELGLPGYAAARRLWLNEAGASAPQTAFHTRLVRRSLGMIVHNETARRQLHEAHGDRPVRHIPLLVDQFPTDNYRARLNLPADAFVFAAVGQLNRHKQIAWSLTQFAAVRQDHPEAHFLLVGEALPGEIDLPGLIRQLGLDGAVHHIDYVPAATDFLNWTAAADVLVALRQPTLGETSAAALNGMAAARPLIVFDQGWYSELPATVALKLPPMDEVAFQDCLRHCLTHRPQLAAMGEAALAYVRREHRPETIARQYLDFCARMLA